MTWKINVDMSTEDIIYVMSKGNSDAIRSMTEMLKVNEEAIHNIFWFDTMEIYGYKIYRLWNDCCMCDIQKLNETIQYINSDCISKEEVHANLSKEPALPFV